MTETVTHEDAARERLYKVIRKEAPFEQKAREALALGRQYLDVENGHLTRIDRETDHWEVIVSTDTADGAFPPGLELDLGTTYCRRAIETETSVALWDASEQTNDPAFEEHGLHCYHGARLVVNHDPYGTICFVSREPREPFSDDETLFVELLARLLERELEREKHAAALTRQTNLTSVLNRVLRHNLRNDMSVVRGFVQLMADELDDASYSETALETIDRLINLSDKARDLDHITTADFERKPTEITGLVEDVAETVVQDYPDASVAVEYNSDSLAAVMPSFDRVLRELIENAAKHGGDPPTVAISVSSVPDAVEIQIADNGPGLAEHEVDVLQTGSETSLIHGTGLGLWLGYWIVTSHGGSIDATSTDEGTVMTISVPRKPTVSVEDELTKLTQARDQYRAAFERANDAMVIVSDDARIIDANSKASQVYGMDEQALLGQQLARFVPDGFDFDMFWRKSHESGAELDTMTLHGGDGVDRTVEYSAANEIVPGQTLIVSRDITECAERQQAPDTAYQQLDTMVRASPDPAFAVDAETGEILQANEAAETLTGEPKELLAGRHHSTLHPAADAQLYRDAFRRAQAERTTVRTLSDGSGLELLTADGDTIPVEISANTVSLPGGPITFAIFRDTTLKEKNERLDKVISIVSHDLRNPLNVAQGRLQLLKDEYQGAEIEDIENAHNRIETLIEDILTLARNGDSVSEPETVVLSDLVESCWRTVDTADATLVVETEQAIRADESRLQQLIENVFRNAIDHGGGDVTLTVGELDTGFRIADDGPGIPADERAQVFESGYSTLAGGTGFGLAIVEEIADAHDWEIRVTESDSGGARFEITGVAVAAA